MVTIYSQHCQVHHAPTMYIVGENKSSRIYIHSRKGIGQLAALTTIVVSARKAGYILVLYRPDDNDMHLLLGQASFPRVSMLCPINRKKLAPSSCSGVTKTIWKDISTTPFMRNQLKQSMSKHLPPTKESKSSKATTNHGEPKTKRQDSVKCSSL
jgi:hypothetical protein